ARPGLGQRVGRDPLAAGPPRQVPLALLRAARQLDRGRAQRLHGEHQADRGVGVGQLLDCAQEGQRAGAGAAVLLAEAECEDAVLAEQLDGTPRELRLLVDAGGVRRDPAAGQGAHGLDQHLLLLGLAMADAHVSISSSLAVVIVSNPSAVTAYMFSMPTAPRPGNTIFGSTAITCPSAIGSSKPGARIGSSSISRPTPWPRKRMRCGPKPMKCSSRPASAAISADRS